MNESVLIAENLTRRFGALAAVDDVSFAIERHAITSLIGPNGAGKSTIFNLLTGYLPISAGRIMFAGRRIDGLPTYRIAQAGIARVFQIARPFRGLSVHDNIRVGALYGRDGARDVASTIDRAIRLAGLYGGRVKAGLRIVRWTTAPSRIGARDRGAARTAAG